ncbi:MAG: hypothetical protein K0Q66_2405 [Chitinophagaceae bacterium]|jgi:hypothetical protein|nr:hypothetical protein [Chitinophagaceae bacterium]
MINEANTNLKEEQTENGRVDEYLPYATDYINTACYCLEVLNGVDGKLFSKMEEQRMQETKKRMMRIIHAASKAMHDDWFDQEEAEAGEADYR